MRFTVVVLTGGPPRPEKTKRALNSLNNQEHSNMEKILVSNGRSAKEISELYDCGALTPDWIVIEFPVNTFIRGDLGSVWRFPGAAALKVATGKYIFFQSDDDSLSMDFFSRMNALFEKHPDAVTGFGLPASWIYESETVIFPVAGAWENRPEIESGQRLLSTSLLNQSYHPNPGFSLVCRTDLVRNSAKTIFEAGFPDWNPLFQIAVQGLTVFDRNATMFWGRHSEQDHFDWDRDNLATGSYGRIFKEIVKCNVDALAMVIPNSKKEQSLISTYFATK